MIVFSLRTVIAGFRNTNVYNIHICIFEVPFLLIFGVLKIIRQGYREQMRILSLELKLLANKFSRYKFNFNFFLSNNSCHVQGDYRPRSNRLFISIETSYKV